MKILKIVLLGALFSVAAIAGKFESNIEAMFKNEIGMEAKIVKSIEVDKGLMFVVAESKDSGMQMPIFASSGGKAIIAFSEKFFVESESVKAKIADEIDKVVANNQKAKSKEIKKLLKELPKESFLEIGSGDKEMLVISDPECPYCRQELANIEKRLEGRTIKMVMAPVHGKSAFIKSDLIYKNAKGKSDKQKIEILRKYFDPEYKLTSSEEKVNPTITEKNAEIVFGSGLISGVPFVMELD